jgi:hypothetical protein
MIFQESIENEKSWNMPTSNVGEESESRLASRSLEPAWQWAHLRDVLDDEQTNTSNVLKAPKRVIRPHGYEQRVQGYQMYYWSCMLRGLCRVMMMVSA